MPRSRLATIGITMGINSFKSDDNRVYEPLENVDLFVNSPTMIPFTYDPYPHPKFPSLPPQSPPLLTSTSRFILCMTQIRRHILLIIYLIYDWQPKRPIVWLAFCFIRNFSLMIWETRQPTPNPRDQPEGDDDDASMLMLSGAVLVFEGLVMNVVINGRMWSVFLKWGCQTRFDFTT